MSKKHKHKFKVGEVVLLNGQERVIMQVYPQYGNLGHYRLDGKPGDRVVPIYSETYLRKIKRD